MEVNEIKKLLYKIKPMAVKVGGNEYGLLYKTSFTDILSHALFLVPMSEVVKARMDAHRDSPDPFGEKVEAQLLIRYLITSNND